MTTESRIYGPPGTGKTTILAEKYIPEAVKRFGEEKIMVTSFTKAAAFEIRNRVNQHPFYYLPESHVGTLHQICFHALGRPNIIEEDNNLLDIWNQKYPHWQIAFSGKSVLDEAIVETVESPGAQYVNMTNILRNRLVPKERWHPELQRFIKAWKEFKQEHGCMDYTDLIEKAHQDLPYAPDNPEILFIDEAQDCTSLQLMLARSWAMQMKHLVLVGDDDQTLYRFMGSTPDAFLHPEIDEKYKRILAQSYRVPSTVLERAMAIIRQVSRRQAKDYRARIDPDSEETAAGEVIEVPHTWRRPEALIELVERYSEGDENVMVLTTCSYMLGQLRNELISRGIPFHNPYRSRTRSDWNPLGVRHRGTSSKDILMAFLSSGQDDPYWSVDQFVTWAKYVKVGPTGLKKKIGKAGIKRLEKAISDNEPNLHTCRNVIGQLMESDGVNAALNRNVEWLLERMPAARQKTIQYPITVFKKHGSDALIEEPSVIIGTVHSVKGGQASNVILFPDVSYKAMKDMQTIAGKDAMLRTMYVGMTRASNRLIIGSPSSKNINTPPRMFMNI